MADMTDTSTTNPTGAPAAAATEALEQRHDYAPSGYHTVTPFLAVRHGAAALDYYTRAFGARVLSRMDGEKGVVHHSELLIGDSVLQVGNELPDGGLVAPGETRTGSFSLYVADVDAVHAAAVAAGGTTVSAVEDAFSGDRMGIVVDPFGHRWVILTRTEHLSAGEIERRARAWMESGAPHADPA
jgi:PhnB protein